ncbi:hypothetical protein DL767_000645 [Monosporascus sp. MG133]|nr:hypothetical protein DL767_000645 [Monosporascus sp. MG133]
MKVLFALSLFTAGALAQNGCGFPDGPDCVSLGEGPNGLEQFADDGCCLLPLRCGNGDGGERCERVTAGSNNNNNGGGNNDNGGNNNNDSAEEDSAPDAGNNNGNNANDDNCGFPDGPDCVSLGEGANGLEQFADDGCCLLPLRCGNGDGGERCERVAVGNNNKARLRRVPRGLRFRRMKN